MRFAPAYGLVAAGITLAACGPVPVAVAERQCYARFAPKAPITGEAGMGVTNEGFKSKVKVEVNLGTSYGDPSAAYNACVLRNSGQMPTRPFYSY